MSYIVLIEKDDGYDVSKFAHNLGDDLSAAMEFLFAYEEALIDESDGFPVCTERDYRDDNSTNYVYFIRVYNDINITTLCLMEDFVNETGLDG